MFKKIGDPLPIKNLIKGDGNEQFCPECHKPMTAIAFDEQDIATSICQCEIDEDIYEKN